MTNFPRRKLRKINKSWSFPELVIATNFQNDQLFLIKYGGFLRGKLVIFAKVGRNDQLFGPNIIYYTNIYSLKGYISVYVMVE